MLEGMLHLFHWHIDSLVNRQPQIFLSFSNFFLFLRNKNT